MGEGTIDAGGSAGPAGLAGLTGLTGLTQTEADLVRAVLAGEPADLQGRLVRAAVVRDLLLEARPGWVLPAPGLRIHQAVIAGCLDLEGATIARPVLLSGCRLEGDGGTAIILRDGRLRRLSLSRSVIAGHIRAGRVEIEHDLAAAGVQVAGALDVRGATIGGTLNLQHGRLGDKTHALQAGGLRLEGPLILAEAVCAGTVSVSRATLATGIDARKLRIDAAGPSLDAESARLGGDLLLDEGEITGGIGLVDVRLAGRLDAVGLSVAGLPVAIDARGLDVSHGVKLDKARLTGSLLLAGAKIGNAFRAEELEIDGGETAVGADVIEVGGNWEMPRARLVGVLAMPGARIAGQLRLTQVRLFGTDIAIRGDGAVIRGGCFMSRATVMGLVRLPAAELGNQLRLRGATLKVEAGAALLAAGATFRRGIELTEGCQITGAVVLDQARIEGALDLQGSCLASAAVMRAGLPAPPASLMAAAHADEIVLSLVDAKVNRLVMPAHADQRPRGILDLSRARAGSFEDYAEAWVPAKGRVRTQHGRDIDHLVLDGFAYEHLTNPAGLPPAAPASGGAHRRVADRVAQQRIQWLGGQSTRDTAEHFKPQAWMALADRLARQGYVDDARRIDIARLRRERRSRSVGAGARWQSRLLDWLALYGHNPWRTVLWMALVVVVFAGVWGSAGRLCGDPECFDETVMVIRNKDAYRDERFRQTYPGFHALAYSFDVFVPFVSFGYEDHWRPNIDYGPIAELPLPWPASGAAAPPGGQPAKDPTMAITIGGILYVLGIIEAVLGLVLTSLMVTGFTGMLKGRGD